MPATRKSLVALAALALAAVPMAGCGDDGGSGGGTVSLVAYSTPQEAYQELIPAFNRTDAGKGVRFRQSYGSSGDQTRAVISGLRADVVALSHAADVNKLIDERLVAPNYVATPTKGIVTASVVVFAVRKGNPKNIKTWEDLVRDEVEVITPNPVTSGGARWNILAAFGTKVKTEGKTEQEGLAFVKQILANTAVQDKSARDALQTFNSGKGDVLIAYENEAITAQQKGLDVDYVIPESTILIENPAAVTTKSRNPRVAKAFLGFLVTPEAQRIFAAKGYRSVLPAVLDTKKYPPVAKQFTIDDLGGWKVANKKYFDADDGLVTKINEDLGVAG